MSALPVAVWAVLGGAVAAQMIFPLAFLLLAVPVGEVRIPPLIDFTAAFVVLGLKLSGVAVLREGNQLTLSNSTRSVVEACSGLRYLIACATVGLLFAYLSYRSWWRRLLCVGAALVVPITANGLRAYLIVMLGYASDMKLAAGIDHLIYGWVFFGVIMFFFLSVASRFSDVASQNRESRPVKTPAGSGTSRARLISVGGAALLLVAMWPAWASQVESHKLPGGTHFSFSASIGSWARAHRDLGWSPYYVGADLAEAALYGRGGELVGVHVAFYRSQSQGAELINSSNLLVKQETGRLARNACVARRRPADLRQHRGCRIVARFRRAAASRVEVVLG